MVGSRGSKLIALIAVFAAVSVVCDSFIGPLVDISSVWLSWIFIAEPLNGVILGPYASFVSTLIGVIVGHSIFFRGAAEFLFTLGAPLGSVITSFVFRGKLKVPLAYYTLLLLLFFLHPVSWQLPLWGMWDVYLAFGCLLMLLLVQRVWGGLHSRGPVGVRFMSIVALSTFIGLEADVLFRIFVLVPCQTYSSIYGLGITELQFWWTLGAVETSVKAALSTLINSLVVPAVLRVIHIFSSEAKSNL
jgi:hypothetical protein